jgi:hypothetical protein
MRKNRMKLLLASIFVVVASLSLAISCDLEFIEKDSPIVVDVFMPSSLVSSPRSAVGSDVNVLSVEVKVIASDGSSVGMGTLARVGSVWRGTITVSQTGSLTFVGLAKDTVDPSAQGAKTLYLGNGTINIVEGGSGYSVTITTYDSTTVLGKRGPAGGWIAYDSGTYGANSWRFLEAAPADLSSGIKWRNTVNITTGSTAIAIGTGQENTNTIITQQGSGSYAASICDNATINGYDDWYLPSKNELNLMYTNIKAAGLGGFLATRYWSSSEYDINQSWYQRSSDGMQSYLDKESGLGVRPLRDF